MANDSIQVALDALVVRLEDATKAAIEEECRAIRDLAAVTARSRTGAMVASIVTDGPREAASISGLEISAPRGPAVYAARVGPTVVYGRIRDTGGRVPGPNTVMTHPFLKWYFMGHAVFYKASNLKPQWQHGNKWFHDAAEAGKLEYHDIMVRHISSAILEGGG